MVIFTRMMYNPFCDTACDCLDLWDKNIHSIEAHLNLL